VQRGDVTVPDGLIPAGVGADALDGQIDLDQALGVGGHCKVCRCKIYILLAVYISTSLVQV